MLDKISALGRAIPYKPPSDKLVHSVKVFVKTVQDNEQMHYHDDDNILIFSSHLYKCIIRQLKISINSSVKMRVLHHGGRGKGGDITHVQV